jgi:hypothetical protein
MTIDASVAMLSELNGKPLAGQALLSVQDARLHEQRRDTRSEQLSDRQVRHVATLQAVAPPLHLVIHRRTPVGRTHAHRARARDEGPGHLNRSRPHAEGHTGRSLARPECRQRDPPAAVGLQHRPERISPGVGLANGLSHLPDLDRPAQLAADLARRAGPHRGGRAIERPRDRGVRDLRANAGQPDSGQRQVIVDRDRQH